MLLNVSGLTTFMLLFTVNSAFPNVMLITHGRRARDSKNPEPRGMLEPIPDMQAPAHRQVTGGISWMKVVNEIVMDGFLKIAD
jgi:hypothetical protein